MPTLHDLLEAVSQGQGLEAADAACCLLEQGVTIEAIIEGGLTRGLQGLDRKCSNEEFNLLDILLAGRALMQVMDVIAQKYPDKAAHQKAKGAIVVGTIEGDIHDLGKNIVQTIFGLSGFEVIDLGTDVEPRRLVEIAGQRQAGFIGVSSLITTTFSSIRKIRPLAREAGLADLLVVAGGGALKQCSPDFLDVDFIAGNVFEGLNFCLHRKGECS